MKQIWHIYSILRGLPFHYFITAANNAETAEVSQEGGADAPAAEGADDPQDTEGNGEQKTEEEGGGENSDAVEPPMESAPEDGQAPEGVFACWGITKGGMKLSMMHVFIVLHRSIDPPPPSPWSTKDKMLTLP